MDIENQFFERKIYSLALRHKICKEHVLEGVKIAEKETKKQTERILKNLYNKYSSHLIDEQRVKLSKIINEAKVRELKAKLEVLKELERKLELPHTK